MGGADGWMEAIALVGGGVAGAGWVRGGAIALVGGGFAGAG